MDKQDQAIKQQVVTLRKKLTKIADIEKLDDAWNGYRTALAIAAGPDPNRASHWQEMAGNRLAHLKRVMQLLQNGVDLLASAKNKSA